MGRIKELLLYQEERRSGIEAEDLATKLGGEVKGNNVVVAPLPAGGGMTVRVNRDGSFFIYECSGSWAQARQIVD
jgi:hypothetical protein